MTEGSRVSKEGNRGEARRKRRTVGFFGRLEVGVLGKRELGTILKLLGERVVDSGLFFERRVELDLRGEEEGKQRFIKKEGK